MGEFHNKMAVAVDAFSSGQVGSKIWLAQLLERLAPAYGQHGPHTIWIYGGWQGVLGLILLSRQGAVSDFVIERIRSFDIDSEATKIANQINENWVWRDWQFRAFTQNCNEIFQPVGSDSTFTPVNSDFGPPPTIVINSSVEHFSERTWFERLPKGTIVVLQASDFQHDGIDAENLSAFQSDTAFAAAYPLAELWFSGSLKFEYGSADDSWSFHRRMLIGKTV